MRLEVIVFPGGHNWPIWAAQAKGYFANAGLEVNLSPTPGSEFQMTRLHAGEFHIAHTALDNVVAYQEAQGPAQLDHPDFLAFMGGDHGFLALAAASEVRTFAELKGRTLSVDAMSTGYAFVLRRMLEWNGIGAGDVKFEAAGGMVERWVALQKKEQAATLLITPFDIIAKAQGFNILARGRDVLGAYQGVVGAAKRSWAAAHRQELVAYIRAYRRALDWLYVVENKGAGITLLREHLKQVDQNLGEAIYAAMIESNGLVRDAAIDMEGARTVLQLRSSYAEPTKTLADPAKYIDLSYYDEATWPLERPAPA